MTTTSETQRATSTSGGLRRELRFWETIALSIGIMAPTAAMALNGTAPAGLIGRAVPLAFIFATIGILFVSYAFIRLSRYFSHAGSVYALSGIRLGPQAGFLAGWALFGTYLAFTAASTAEAGTFGVAFFLGATVSAFASGLGAATAGARILFALGRDTPLAPVLGRASTRTGAPAGALTVVLAIGVGAIVVQRLVGVSAVNAFFYPGTIGVLSILVAYMLTNLGAINYLFVRARRVPMWEIVIPIVGIGVLGYTLYKNVQGVSFPYSRFPLVVGIWLVIGLAIVLISPGLSRRIGTSLAREAESDEPTA
jgi:amino acid transporter